MDRSRVIQLVTETETQDSFGVWHKELEYKNVYANVSSVSAQEFFEGGKIGLRPDFRITVFGGDYDGQEMLVLDGKSYAIYRTFQGRTDSIELYVCQKGGADGKGDNS